jgi:hypothetical protein
VETEQMSILLGLASPEPVLAIAPSELAALGRDLARRAQLVRLRFSSRSRLRAFGLLGKEQVELPFARCIVTPIWSGESHGRDISVL